MNPINHSDLSKPIYEKLKSMILNNELRPGEKIIQEKLAHNLGVSRTPLNKALQFLEFELLVESIPRKGVYVKRIDLNEMLEAFVCRECLDSLAARLSASKHDPAIAIKLKKIFEPFLEMKDEIPVDKYRRADEEFHKELVNLSGNKILNRLFLIDNTSRKIFQMGLIRPPEETLFEHLKIIDGIEKNEPKKAATAAATHIRKTINLIAEYINDRENKLHKSNINLINPI